MTSKDKEFEEAVDQLKNAIERLGELDVNVYTIVGSVEEDGPLASITTINNIDDMLKIINRAKKHLEVEYKKMIAQNN